jgi:hypothetical protein
MIEVYYVKDKRTGKLKRIDCINRKAGKKDSFAVPTGDLRLKNLEAFLKGKGVLPKLQTRRVK